MLIFGAWGLLVLNNAEIDVALADEAIMVGLAGGGFAGGANALKSLPLSEQNHACCRMEKDYLVLRRASASRPSGEWKDGK
jgi:hypothetical protein